jgi:hypothetical protein
MADAEDHSMDDGISSADWAEVEQDLQRLCVLQTEASHRMEALRRVWAMEETGLISTIQSCHDASLLELEQTGEVTFGTRLLSALKGSDKA